jgi:hypothetical protein
MEHLIAEFSIGIRTSICRLPCSGTWHHASILKMGEACFSEASMSIYQIAWRHILEGSKLGVCAMRTSDRTYVCRVSSVDISASERVNYIEGSLIRTFSESLQGISLSLSLSLAIRNRQCTSLEEPLLFP